MPSTIPLIQAAPDRQRYLLSLQRRAARIKRGVAKYYDDPVGFAADCIDWRDDGLAGYQQEVIGELPARKRISVRGPHGLGKGTIAATTVLWFALTRDAAGVDWKIPTTAGSWHQLTQYLWPEVRKWAGRLRWDKVRDGRPFTRNELQNLNLRLSHGHAFAGASANPGLIEGAHADSLLFVYDESKMIPAMTFDACEGAFSGTGEAYALCLSTPGPPQGRFYDIQSRKPGYEDWHARHVTLDEAIAAGRISEDWAAQRALQWGVQSSIYVNRVLGEFHAGDEDSVIPLAWAEAAVERWHEWDLAGRPGTEMDYPRTVGVDVARFGCFDDQTEILTDDGWKLFDVLKGTERVLTLNGDHSEWGPITQVHKYPFDGHLNVYDAKGASFAITDNHRLLMRSPSYDNSDARANWHLREFRDMPRYSYVRRCAGWTGGNPASITFEQRVPMHHGGTRDRDWTFDWLDFCEFVGWFVSEGNVYHEKRRNGRARIMVAQNPGPKLDQMYALLHRMGFAVRVTGRAGNQLEVHCRPLAAWLDEHCGVTAPNKRIPQAIKESSPEAIERFLDAYCSGDGHQRESGGCTYYTTSPGLVDDLQEVLAKLGTCGKATRVKRAGSTGVIDGRVITRAHDTWAVGRYRRPQDIYLDKANVRRERYDGFVHCVSTPHQTIMVRRNGVVMWSGNSNRTVLAIRNGPALLELRKTAKEDTMQTAGRVKAVLDADAARTAVIDVIGVGGGVFDRLREQGCKVQAFNASSATDRRDKTNEFSFNNVRSAAWWGMREQLDPSADSDVCLPDDDMLLGDLSAPQWKVTSGGKIAVESKEEIEKRLGRSTDDGDACVESYWPRSLPHAPSARQWAAHDDLERLAEDRTRRRPGDQRSDWDSPDAWAPQDDDGRPDRPNVRSWR